MRDALWLVKNGISFDLAFGMPDTERKAFAIIFSEHEGASFDWSAMKWKEMRA